MGKRTVSDDKKVVVKSLVDSGMSYRKVNEITGVSLGFIGTIVKEFEASRELVSWYEKNKSNVLLKAQLDSLALQEAIRNSITGEDIKKWTPDQKARWYSALGVDYGIKFDKERLQSEKSTENVSVIVEMIKESRKRIREENARLTAIPSGDKEIS